MWGVATTPKTKTEHLFVQNTANLKVGMQTSVEKARLYTTEWEEIL